MATGAPREVMTRDMLREVFGVEAAVHVDPRTGAPLVIPVGLSGQLPDGAAIPDLDLDALIAAMPTQPVESLHA